ncbi:MAG: sensor histidine kinase, partial [Candidatus Gallimonas sp.]
RYFFAGAFFLMSDPNVSLLGSSAAFNTTALGLSFMLYFFSVMTFITYFVAEKCKFAAKITAGVSGAVTAVIIIVALFSDLYFYNLWSVWNILQSVVALVMLGFTGYGMINGTKNRFFVQAPFALVLPAFMIDLAAIALGWWGGCIASEIAFVVLFSSLLVLTLRVLPHNIRAAMREKELLAERKALQAELKQSRFSIMLSQIQPHFLYNTLNAIYHLCGKDTQTAQEAISSFSDYLRNNLDSLDYKDLITFDKELQHIKTYLDLEKIRFGDELSVIYDIRTSAFSLPIMSVQPLVENAVKHGVSKRKGGGFVTVATRETDDAYVVAVIDTGVGFDVMHYADDGKTHIGIENVRQRLQAMCDATLQIVSEIDRGTTVTITIPKKGGAV